MGRGALLEVCVESVEDAVAAAAAGADRIELNCALALEGLTPTPGLLIETRRAVRLPLVAMARPRPGCFCYSDSEFRVLRRDVDFALDQGADGVAVGVLTPEREVDVRRCRVIARCFVGNARQLVFHKAFDKARDPAAAMERLIDLGFHRVMTSGGRPTAVEGAQSIRRLIDLSAARIEILPAGGIRPGNARRVITGTRCDQIHTSLRDSSGHMSARALSALVRVLDTTARIGARAAARR
jgi:copper homeostasis protein